MFVVIGVLQSVTVRWDRQEQRRREERGRLNCSMGQEYRMKQMLQKLRGNAIYFVNCMRIVLQEAQ